MYIIVMYVIMRIDSVIFIPYLFLIAERCVSAMEKKVDGTTCRGEQTMLVGKRDGRGGQVMDENGDPVVERVGSLGTTSRQWDMLIRTLFHDTNERPIRVCIGVCPAPTAMSPPSPQPGAGEEPRGGGCE